MAHERPIMNDVIIIYYWSEWIGKEKSSDIQRGNSESGAAWTNGLWNDNYFIKYT